MKHLLYLTLLLHAALTFAAWNGQYDLTALPIPNNPDFKVEFLAKEPELMHEVCMCFDKNGNLMLGGGSQFRWPLPETPKDKIKVLIDKDGTGKNFEIKIFAEGFNCIQAMAWKGNDLWVIHAPQVTIVRDLDGDGVADEFVDVFTGLGPLRHGCHGANFGPDGKLYLSQGNNTCTKDAPKAWRDLMHVVSDAPDIQPLRKYTKAEWKVQYIKPYNDESEGGILRCDADGTNLEIFARGMRNPWDIAFDSEFNWIGGDNDDGPEHDRVFGFFRGANMGHRHPWSKSWTGDNAPGVAPSSALFAVADGSAVGTVFYTSTQFPEQYRNGFFMGDSDGEKVYFFRPEWDGAHRKVKLETFAHTQQTGRSALFMPTDVEVGPDGALYVISWGSTYGSIYAPYHKGKDDKAKINEGRVFKFWYDKNPLIAKSTWFPAKRTKAYSAWTFDELMEDMGNQIPVWRVAAQDEFVKRGAAVKDQLVDALNAGKLNTAQETWSVWAIGRMDIGDKKADAYFDSLLASKSQNLRLQAIRILEFRKATDLAPSIAKLAKDAEARVRFEVAEALWHLNAKPQSPALLDAIASETDRTTFYAQWRGLQELSTPEELKKLMTDERGGVRRAALLALLETTVLTSEEVLVMARDKDADTRKIAGMWLLKLGKNLPADSLIDMLSDANADTRNTALACLSRTKLTPATLAKLGEMHAKATGADRALLLSALCADMSSVPVAFAELNSDDAAIRMAAINGMSKHPGTSGKLFDAHLTDATPAQRDGAIIALSYAKKLAWPLNPDKLKALTASFASQDSLPRRAVVNILNSVVIDAPSKTAAGELAAQATIDADPEVRRVAEAVCKKLGVKALKRKIEGIQIDQVVPLVANGDPVKGKELFFSAKIGCFNCHVLDKKGTAVGPDLSDIGLRADKNNITESLLDPSKVIIEGFQPINVKTKEGAVFTGLLRDESDEALWLLESTGKLNEIPKKEISKRTSLNISFMPGNFSELLTPTECADLVAWLLNQKQAKAGKPADGKAIHKD
ncbi:MAG: PVC-type heme-binding CxxCH protein [Planctomycetota bacterium]